MMKRPNSVRHLDDAVRRLSDGTPQGFVRVRTLLANAIVASMLPDGVIKGGCAIKMRFGDEATRFTTDLDTARPWIRFLILLCWIQGCAADGKGLRDAWLRSALPRLRGFPPNT